jgi:integrase
MGKPRKPTERLAFTKRSLESLPIPTTGRRHIYDDNVRELGFRIESSGRKTFFWFRKVRGRGRFKSIGIFPSTSIEQARGRAHELSGDLDKLKRNDFEGRNPFERPRGEPTLEGLLDDYIEKHLRLRAKNPDKASKDVRWMFGKYAAAWKGRKLSTVRRKDVLDLHHAVGENNGHYTANRLIQLFRALFNFAIRTEVWSGDNPASKIERFREDKRKRFLQPDEMPKLFAALKSEPNADVVDFVNLSLWTGARKNDIFTMSWQDVLPLENNKWSVPDPKGDPYVIALTIEAVNILKKRLSARKDDNHWVFPSFGKSGHLVDLKGRWKELLKRAGIQNLRLHDLRRTLGSWQAGRGISLPIIGKSLGHKSVQATAIYAQLDLQPVREAVGAATRAMIAASKKKPKALLPSSKA